MPAINENLRVLRQARRMTQADVAEAISVSRQTVSSYESGRTQPDLETLKRLAAVYQADLHDVLYGGNRLQRLLHRVKIAAIILTAIMLLGILTHSVLYWIMNHLYKFPSGTAVSADSMSVMEMRYSLRFFADRIAVFCTYVFCLGCCVVIYPSIKICHVISFRKLFLSFSSIILAMFVCVIPFATTDDFIWRFEYYFVIWNMLIIVLLFFLVILTTKIIKRRKTRESPAYPKSETHSDS